MVLINDTPLVTRNARDKIQTSRFLLYQDTNNYIIERYTGQYGGKITKQPDKVIERGKAKRSVLMQAELEYNSLIKKSLDKGYKRLSDLSKITFDNITEQELFSLIPSIKTDASGNIKPQLAKSSNDCTINIFDKPVFCSRKIDGVRAMFKWNKDTEEVVTVSRGGKNYDPATIHLRKNDALVTFLRNNQDIILDGELYVHGWSLQKISGTSRLKTWDQARCSSLEFFIFDIANLKEDFNQRLDTLTDLNLYFEEEPQITVLEHELAEGWRKVKKLHDKYVAEGFEGLVARKPHRPYGPGKRNSDWVKLKDYKEDEFEIIGVVEKSRPEDFTFELVTKEGKTFEAKPIGTRELRMNYLENWEDYVGKLGTIKFFNLTDDNVPSQPIFKHIREKGE